MISMLAEEEKERKEAEFYSYFLCKPGLPFPESL